MIITSAENPKIKHVRKLAARDYRHQCQEFIIEGERAVIDAEHNGFTFTYIFVSLEYGGFIPEACPIHTLPEKLFAGISGAKNPQGILTVAQMPRCTYEQIVEKSGGCIVFCDRIQDPGNLGSIIRTAGAVAAQGVIVSPGCVDPYSPKVVRSATGACISTVFAQDSLVQLKNLQKIGYTLCVSALSDRATELFSADLPEKSVFVVGNEANGAEASISGMADMLLRIPMPGSGESLNAAVAAGIILYEHYRQNM